MGTKKSITLDVIKAARKASREQEIKLYGKQISLRSTKIKESKKIYKRNRNKKNPNCYDNNSDFLFPMSFRKFL